MNRSRAARISKIQRWLDLLAFLLERRTPVPAATLLGALPAYAEGWSSGDPVARESARRTFERDKEALRRAGFAIRMVESATTEDGEEGPGYRLARGDFYLPVLRLMSRAAPSPSRTHPTPERIELPEEDARLAVAGLRHVAALPGHLLAGEARSALRKLTFDLDRSAFPAGHILVAPPTGAAADPGTLRALFEALTSRARVRFRYRGIARNRTTRRRVEPYALLLLRGRWYLAGRDETRRAVRVFRVSRILELERGDGAAVDPEYEIPVDFDAADLMRREAWELGGDGQPSVARVRFAFPSSLTVGRLGAGEVVEAGADGAVLREFRVSEPGAFVRWLLSFQGDAEVVEPEGMRAAMRRIAREVARLHAPRRPPAVRAERQRKAYRPRRRARE